MLLGFCFFRSSKPGFNSSSLFGRSGCGSSLAGSAMEQEPVPVLDRRGRGRQPKNWEPCEIVERDANLTLRQNAARWLQAKEVVNDPLSKSSSKSSVTFIATCKDPKQYIRIITPPQCISSACWGPEVTLCVSMDRHFDATENL